MKRTNSHYTAVKVFCQGFFLGGKSQGQGFGFRWEERGRIGLWTAGFFPGAGLVFLAEVAGRAKRVVKNFLFFLWKTLADCGKVWYTKKTALWERGFFHNFWRCKALVSFLFSRLPPLFFLFFRRKNHIFAISQPRDRLFQRDLFSFFVARKHTTFSPLSPKSRERFSPIHNDKRRISTWINKIIHN